MLKSITAAAILMSVGVCAEAKLKSDDLQKIFDRGGKVPLEVQEEFQLKILPLKPLKGVAETLDTKTNRYFESQERKIDENPTYRGIEKFLGDSRFSSIPQERRRTFSDRAKQASATRLTLLGSSQNLDAEDEALYQEGQRLDKRGGELNAEIGRLNAAIDAFNRFCTGRRLPPEDYNYCVREKSRLTNWQNDLSARVTSHNREFQAWEAKLASFKPRVNSFLAAISDWENLLVALYDDLQAALDNVRYGNCTEEEHEVLFDRYSEICKRAPFECLAGSHCADVGSNIKKNVDCEKAARSLNDLCFESRHPEYGPTADRARGALAGCRTQFDQRCQGWDPVFGTCKPERHKPLQDAVDAACPLNRSCREVPAPPPSQCRLLGELFDRGLACYQSRRQINTECYDGGDAGHRQAEEDARLTAEYCLGRLVQDECENAPRMSWQ